MAKKKAGKVGATKEVRTMRAVRLDLSAEDHERLDRIASRLGLSKSSYSRMILLKQMEAEEAGRPGA